MKDSLTPARHRQARAVRWLVAVAVIGMVTSGAGAAAAKTVSDSAAARAAREARGLLSGLQPIALNTPEWTAQTEFGARPPAWYTDRSGVVHLQGGAVEVADGPTEQVIGVLPPAARPSSELITIVNAFDGTYADLEIDPDGVIFFFNSPSPAETNLNLVSFEGITFRPDGHSTPVAVNTPAWTGSVFRFRPLAWYKDRSGIVHLQGCAGNNFTGANPNVIGTLPPQARPARAVYTIVATSPGTGSYADLAIEPNGQILLLAPRPPAATDIGVVSLESITYRPSGRTGKIAINSANWTGSAGFQSGRPGWYTDNSGLIHLQGGVHQTSATATGPGGNLIGTLPPAARPSHTVYTIVHTFEGTYADLSIRPDGRIILIDPSPSPPLFIDYTFVSLESISYRR